MHTLFIVSTVHWAESVSKQSSSIQTDEGIVGSIFGLTEKDPEKNRGKFLTTKIDREKDRGKFLTPKIDRKLDRDKVLGTKVRFL